ncbi:hypothetical protein Ciccas_010722 [Cichlidogyrus casuarinus]|uniref:Uncharacterized protein n=1 Tax=Cichlidogyrus casuarinus TaxID=1844966 RepID=A0ABD2PVC4_9PLAT
MNDIAEAIARKLGGSKEKQWRNLTEELALISQPYALTLHSLMLIISNAEQSFAGKEGYKTYHNREVDPCPKLAIIDTLNPSPLPKCEKWILRQGDLKIYEFTWPQEYEYSPDMCLQLRFYYKNTNNEWYATKVYPIDDTKPRNSEFTNINSDLLTHLFRALDASIHYPNYTDHRLTCSWNSGLLAKASSCQDFSYELN